MKIRDLLVGEGFFESVPLLFRDAHERPVLWSCHARDVDGRIEVSQVLVGLADAVVFGS